MKTQNDRKKTLVVAVSLMLFIGIIAVWRKIDVGRGNDISKILNDKLFGDSIQKQSNDFASSLSNLQENIHKVLRENNSIRPDSGSMTSTPTSTELMTTVSSTTIETP